MPFQRHRHDFRRHWHPAEPGPAGIFDITSFGIVSTTETSVTFTWTASAVCSGQIEYGATTAYGSTTTLQVIGGGYSTHVQTITGLSAGQTIHLRAVSVDASSNTAYTPDVEVTTDGAAAATSHGPRTTPTYPTTTYTIPSSIADDGVTDVTSALQSYIDSVGAGASPTSQKVVIWDQTDGGAGSTYRITSSLVFDDRHNNVRHFGWNAKLYNDNPSPHTNPATDPTIRCDGAGSPLGYGGGVCQGITFEGLEIYGNLSRVSYDVRSVFVGEYQFGVCYYGDCYDMTIKDCIIRELNGDGIYFNGNSPWDFRRILIEHNNMYKFGRQGIALNGGQDIEVGWNIVRDVALFCFDSEDNKSDSPLYDLNCHDNVFASWNWHLTGSPGTASTNYFRAHAISFTSPWDQQRLTFRDNQIGDASHAFGATGTGGAEGWGGIYGQDDTASPHINFNDAYGTVFVDVVVDSNTSDMPSDQLARPVIRAESVNGLDITDNDFQGMSFSIVNSTDVTQSGNT